MDQLPTRRQFSDLRSEYLPLHKYLKNRFADVVVLTFTQIEDLLDAPLPPVACAQAAWWTDANADGTPSPQSQAWLQAERTAVPNVGARVVSFARVSG